MGHGHYDSGSRAVRSKKLGYATASASEIFKQRKINTAMDPKGTKETSWLR